MKSKLFKEFFKTDADGKPVARFKINISTSVSASVLNPDHCALIYSHIHEIDKELERLTSFIDNDVDENTLEKLINDIEKLARHGDKLISQAFYLDTKDRNSWATINQTFRERPPGTEFFKCMPKLLDIAKHCDNLKLYAEAKILDKQEINAAYSQVVP